MMRKAISAILLLSLACVIAGVYGALHNQISYTVSPDYFHQFKFIQFGIGGSIPGRPGAAIVGWAASWWMGLVIGAFVIPFGLRVPGALASFLATLWAFAVVAATALATGLAALAIAYVVVPSSVANDIVVFGQTIRDPAAFMRAGAMHNFSYVGGVLGIVTGCVHLGRRRGAAAEPGDA